MWVVIEDACSSEKEENYQEKVKDKNATPKYNCAISFSTLIDIVAGWPEEKKVCNVWSNLPLIRKYKFLLGLCLT